jgi:hypothetical protein
MALVKSQTWTQISGSVGGVTWAHAGSGYYMRARTIPVDPQSMFQGQIRAALTASVVRYSEQLTESQRLSWTLYAQNVTVLNALGDAIMISGQNWYIATNTPREQATNKGLLTMPMVDQAPSIFDRGDLTTPTNVSVNTDGIELTINTGDEWASEDDAAMFVYMGRPRNPSANFFKGPFRLVAVIAGTATPTAGLTILAADVAANGWPLMFGERTTIEVAVTRADGRLTTRRQIFDGLVASP